MTEESLPDTIGKQEFSIGEVAEILNVKAHTIRFWEKSFNIQVNRKDSGRRIYNLSDISLLKKIQKLLHKENMKIKGAKERLKAEGAIQTEAKPQMQLSPQDTERISPPDPVSFFDDVTSRAPTTGSNTAVTSNNLKKNEIVSELKEILRALEPVSR